jgi:hypothetical protein
MAEWYDRLLELQLRKNLEIWTQLERHGIAADSELRLGFVYVAPGEAQARSLVGFLERETDYDVDARAREDESDPEWVVIGMTQPTPLTRERLDDWVEWMIAAGAAEGPCAFDGWAAQMVSA